MAKVFLSLGSDVGDRLEFLARAVAELRKRTEITSLSSVYDTEPKGMKDRRRFYNMAAEIRTDLSPRDLLRELKGIERALGRKDHTHLLPREIDIDILLYESVVYRDGVLSVPHPRMEQRRFVLEPLHEIAPDIRHPVTGQSISSLLEHCQDRSNVTRTDHTVNSSYASKD